MTAKNTTKKILITGAAGLVGQNLIARLHGNPRFEILAIDKHTQNLATLQKLHPEVHTIHADLSRPGIWQHSIQGINIVVMLHAQIGGLKLSEFENNNVIATQNVLDMALKEEVEYLVQISSSVVKSQAIDHYTETKKLQEQLVLNTPVPQVILRPTLMFGWFDRKHLGWLQRFMENTPVFPIPGSGQYPRQPLFVGDFCSIIESCIQKRHQGTFDISGLEHIDYIDLIRAIRSVSRLRTPIVKIPFQLFKQLLRLYAIFDGDPPFTTTQLDALVIPELFDTIDWPAHFDIQATSFSEALQLTFCDPHYSQVILDY